MIMESKKSKITQPNNDINQNHRQGFTNFISISIKTSILYIQKAAAAILYNIGS